MSRNITIDASMEGRAFEGFGAVSAGASSRLLIDYPEPNRSQILDYLFKPKFGANLQHLKVEIGGDMNSTDGAEPSHMRSPDEENYERGYEWWLMKEAKARNRDIYLDCLEWGAPGWVMDGNGKLFSQENISYIINYINGAKDNHGLHIDYAGIWNETPYDVQWIKNLKDAVVANNLARGLNTKIVAADQSSIHEWDIVKEMEADMDLYNAVDVVGAHYPNNYDTTLQAQNCRKPLWASENGAQKSDWNAAGLLAKMYNRSYITGKITKTLIWSPISSYYENLVIPDSGLMKANEPWSGYYEVRPPIWTTAHTTQFAEPGWKYIESGCGFLFEDDKIIGSYVTLKRPESGDYSIIIETIDANACQDVSFNMTEDFSSDPLHVWYSNSTEQFIRQPEDIVPQNGSFSIILRQGYVYSLTTTTGQQKGVIPNRIPEKAGFPLSHAENFESYAIGKTPRYFSDMDGAFEISEGGRDDGKCLRQVATRRAVEWMAYAPYVYWNPDPLTIIGNKDWIDYEVSTDVFIEGLSGYVNILGRINFMGYVPNSYRLSVNQNGRWRLCVTEVGLPYLSIPNSSVVTLASGTYSPFSSGEWHRLKLQFFGADIRAFIDEKQIADVINGKHKSGMAGIGSGRNYARFDNFIVQPYSELIPEEIDTSFVTEISNIDGIHARNDFEGYMGMEIRIGGADICVKELGRYFVEGNRRAHIVKIIRASDSEEIAMVSLDLNIVEKDELGFKYHSLASPVILHTNTRYYIVSQEESGQDAWYGMSDMEMPQLKTSGRIVIKSGVYYTDGVWKRNGGRGSCNVPLNFKY